MYGRAGCLTAENGGFRRGQWTEDGENWAGETLNGSPFELPEPPPNVIWTRDDFNLDEEGVLELTYQPTKRIPKMENVIGTRMFHRIMAMMTEPSVTDGGICILELAAQEFHFNCDQAATFIAMFTDACSRINVLALLQPRLVDLANLTAVVYAGMSGNELRGLERKIGSLFYFTPTNPTGHYSLELANRYDRYIARKLIEISSEEKVYRTTHGMINTSQKGDWDNWRNEHLNKQPWDYDENDTTARDGVPESGLLELDYVSTNCSHRMVMTPPIGEEEFSDFLADLAAVHANVATGKPTILVVEAAPKPSDTDAGVAALDFFGEEAQPEKQSSNHDGTAEALLTEPDLVQCSMMPMSLIWGRARRWTSMAS